MKPKEYAFEFLETIFFIALILFFVFYLFLGGHYELAKSIFLIGGTLSLLGLFFVKKFKIARQEIEKLQSSGRDESVLFYLLPKDVFWDRTAIMVISILVLVIPMAFNKLAVNDAIISGTVFLFMTLWRIILFRKRDLSQELVSLTKTDSLRDETVVFLLPIVLLLEISLKANFETINFFQILTVFLGFYFQHFRLFHDHSA